MLLLSAPAKINLCLQVIGKREDGFHEIDSIMQTVSLFDEIKLSQDEGIKVFCSNPLIPTDDRNTCFKAAKVFFEKARIDKGVRIEIKKHIPEAAGLAGGSSDAAAVLFGLNKLYAAKLSESELKSLGEEVGSDVPFCLTGGTCRVRGRGELVSKIAPLPKSFFIIVAPHILVSTAWVYQNFDRFWIKEKKLAGMHTSITALQIFNDLEKVVFWKHPEVEKLKKQLIEMGCLQAGMSGSGPSVFGLCDSKDTARKIRETIRKQYPQSYSVESVASGPGVLGS